MPASRLAVLRIERLPLVRVDGPDDPLVTHPTPLYVRPTADACAECVRIDPGQTVMRLELDGVVHTMVTGALLKRDKVPLETCAWRTVELPAAETTCADGKLPRVSVVYGRCEASMRWLDGIYRRYVDRYPFKRPLAIKSVAGSGKTTTLLKLAARFKAQRETDDALRGKRILYIAFNKQLVEELRGKLHAQGLTGVLTPLTFDALVKRTAEMRFEAEGRPFHLVGALTPTTLTEANPWFQGKPYAMKKGLINQFAQFCQHPTATHPRELFPNKSMLAKLWEDTVRGTFLTFDGLRKRAHQEHWMRDILDAQYARVFVDEAQDFDPIMLDILLTDTQAPKVFVGDPKQQIYEWRGTINAFERLPPDTLTLEFYTTFRMGEPATSEVATLTKTPMISGVPDRDTRLTTAVTHGTMPTDTPYTYLFRSWRGLLTTAQTLGASLPPGTKLWVHDFDRQMRLMESLHERLTRPGRRQTSSGGNHACPEDDDLPAFLMKLTHEELAALKDAIQQRRAPSKAAAHVRLYTIHAYKGLEAEVVRVAGDVDRESEPNLHYVALTRGTGHVFVDALDEATQAKADQRARSGGGGATQWGEVKTTRTVGAKRGGGGGGGGAPRPKPPPLAEQLRALPAETRAVAEALAALRKTRAAETGKPPYTVFPNRVLLALATARPADVVGLRAIHGVGDKLVASVGAEVLAVLAEAS